MEILDLPLAGLKLIRPRVFTDDRGYFLELMSRDRYAAAGLPAEYVQDNLSFSRRGVLRGLHYQSPSWQGKLVTTMAGEIFDVAVDLRRESPTFGKWYGHRLTAGSHEQLYVPERFAHGFFVISETAYVHYKCTAPYDARSEHTILATDPDLGIEWPAGTPILSAKDAAGRRFREAVL